MVQPYESKLVGAWWALRLGLGGGLFLAGLDKFFDKLATWSMYLSPLAERLLPISSTAFLRVTGVGEMVLGAVIVAGWAELGGYLMALWLLGISANLALAGSFWDLAMRDAEMSIAAFTLARLTAWRNAATASHLAVGSRAG
jgi:uncharacterized membrane protein YphA (DoxX/SURF4 family)